MIMTRKLNNNNGLQDWKKEHQAVTAGWCHCLAAGATQGNEHQPAVVN